MSAREGAATAPGQAALPDGVVAAELRELADFYESSARHSKGIRADEQILVANRIRASVNRAVRQAAVTAAAAAQGASGDLAVIAGRLGYALAALDMIVLYHGDGALGIAEKALGDDKAIRERSPQPAPAPAAPVGTAWRLLGELRQAIQGLAEQVQASADATRPSKKTSIEDEIAIQLRKLTEGK